MAFKLGTPQTLALGSAAVTSASVGTGTQFVRLASTGACHVAIGPAPVATASDALINAGQRGEYFQITAGHKVSVIQDGTSTGNLSITEVS